MGLPSRLPQALLATVLGLAPCAPTEASAQTEPVRLTHGPGRETAPIFAPDGRQILYIDQGEAGGLYSMRADGSDPARLAAGSGERLYVSPRGSAVVFGGCGWTVVDLAGGALLYQGAFNCLSGGRPSWSPEGGRLAVLREQGFSSADYSLEIVVVGTEERAEIATVVGAVQHFNRLPAWSPQGRSIAYASSRVHAAANGIDTEETLFLGDVDGSDSRALVTYRWLTQTPAAPDEHNRYRIKALAWSPDGGRIAFVLSEGAADFTLSDGSDTLFLVSVEGGAPRRLGDSGRITDFAFSPAGDRIAFDRDGDIYLADLAGDTTERLTTHLAADTLPAWSPDGHAIVFTSGRSGGGDIYLLSIEGTTAVSKRSWGALKNERTRQN